MIFVQLGAAGIRLRVIIEIQRTKHNGHTRGSALGYMTVMKWATINTTFRWLLANEKAN